MSIPSLSQSEKSAVVARVRSVLRFSIKRHFFVTALEFVKIRCNVGQCDYIFAKRVFKIECV